jgi:hypothetical protein
MVFNVDRNTESLDFDAATAEDAAVQAASWWHQDAIDDGAELAWVGQGPDRAVGEWALTLRGERVARLVVREVTP